MGGVSYKEIEETTGLLESESSADEDDEVRLINGFDIALPLSGQVKNNLSGKRLVIFSLAHPPPLLKIILALREFN